MNETMNETINAIINTPFSVIVNETIHILNNLHFIRADWFYAFVPLILYLILAGNRTQSDKNWHPVIDEKLLPFVLTKSDHKRRSYPLLLVFIAGSLCITALSGPVYKKLPQPVYREQSSLVILLDLSQSMNAMDIKPSRLSRAKLELLDILKTRKTGQTALIVYAADAFVVTPLTDDNATIANLVPALETDMMPAQGSNLSAALSKTTTLFKQSGVIKGDILVVTDDIRQADKEAIKKVQSQGFRLSVFGIGTSEGAPIPLQGSVDGGFLQDSNGAIVIPKLQPDKLQSYALTGGGLYTGLRAGDSDVNKLSRLFQSSEIAQDTNNKDMNADVWQEEGHWLLVPLLLFAALWARKGWIAVILPFAVVFTLSLPQAAYAETTIAQKPVLDTKNLWSSPDQKAMRAFNQGDTKKAAEQFTQPEWKASAYYRSGDYESAARTLENTSNSDGLYNKANALAKLGKYEESIKAYDRALELNENNEDAKFNREQVKKALEQQQQNTQQESSDKNKEQDNSEQEKNQQASDNQNSQDQQSKDQQEQQQHKNQAGEQSSEENQSEEKQKADQNQQTESPKDNKGKQQAHENQAQEKQAEEQQLKQRDAEAEEKQQQQEQQQYEQDQKQQKQSEASENKDIENKDSDEKPAEIEINPMEASITEEEKATEQWLKRIPDDPGGLLRRKFLYQYKQIPDQKDDNEPW